MKPYRSKRVEDRNVGPSDSTGGRVAAVGLHPVAGATVYGGTVGCLVALSAGRSATTGMAGRLESASSGEGRFACVFGVGAIEPDVPRTWHGRLLKDSLSVPTVVIVRFCPIG